MKSLAEARLKRVRALALVAEGKSYEEVANAVGYAHRGSAHRAVFKALDERELENVDDLRRLEVDRLDALQVALWDRARAGEVSAINVVLRIIDQRSRLLGLLTSRSRSPASEGVISLVVGPLEGNPERATMAEVRAWSQRPHQPPPRE